VQRSAWLAYPVHDGMKTYRGKEIMVGEVYGKKQLWQVKGLCEVKQL
jgi:hypothetical protein